MLEKEELTPAQRTALKKTQCFQRQKLDTYDDFMQAVLQLGRFPIYGKAEGGSEHNLRRKIEDKRKRGGLSAAEYITLRSKSEGFLSEEHPSIMQRLTDFLQTLEANGEDPRLPVCARGKANEGCFASSA